MKNFLKSIAIGTTDKIKEGIVNEIVTLAKSNVYEISYYRYEYQYSILCEILKLMNKNQYIKNCKDSSDLKNGELKDGALYYIKTNDKNFIRVRHSRKMRGDLHNSDEAEKAVSLTVTIIGPTAKHLFETINNAIRLKKSNKIAITKNMTFGSEIDTIVHPMSFNDIIMNLDDKNMLVASLEAWRKDKNWHAKHKLTYKKGILLYGESGTGKTSIAKAISGMFGNCRIFAINPDTIHMDLRSINYNQSDTEYMVVLIEDIDLIFARMENNADKDSKINIVMQMLDGGLSTDNTIYIATTNHIEALAENLIRAGRFDIKLELKAFEKEQALKYIQSLGYDEDTLNDLNVEYPIKPSQLKADLIMYRAKNK